MLSSPAMASDILDLMNQLQRGESSFVSNTSEYSEWNYGQISGLEGKKLDGNVPRTSSLIDSELDSSNSDDRSGKKSTSSDQTKIAFSYSQDRRPESLRISTFSTFSLHELAEAFKANGFQVTFSQSGQNNLGQQFQVSFDKAPIRTILKWLSALTGRRVTLSNQTILL